MLPFHDHHSFLEKSFSEQLELNPHLSPRNFYLPSSPPSFYIPEGLHDILNYLPTAAGAATMLPSPLPVPPLQGDPLDETKMGVREAMGNNESVSRRRFARKDRHSKIYTATGPRDRRMRLSLEVARKFFDLQDMLRFDKASQTVQWLLNKSKGAIRELASVSSQKLMCSISHQSPNSESYTSECEDVVSTISDSKGKSTMLNNTASEEKKPRIKRSSANKSSTCRKAVLNPTLAKESRAKARERARERTKEKKRMCWTNSSTSFNVVEDESGLMQQNYLTPQSFEERYLSSHNYQYSIGASNEKTDHYDELQVAGGSDLTPILDYGTYNHNTATSITDAAGIFQEQWDMERVLLTDGQIHSRQLMEVFNSRPAA